MDNDSDYVMIHSSILNWKHWDNDVIMRIMLYCLLESHNPVVWKRLVRKRQCCVSSFNKISLATHIDIKDVKKALKLLDNEGIIILEKHKSLCCVTFVGYDEEGGFKPQEKDIKGFVEDKKYKQEHLYLIKNTTNSAVKIGKSCNPTKRLKQLQTSCPDKLELISVLKYQGRREKEFHEKFSNLRLSGEWFKDDGSILEYYRRENYE